jgi:hypothetical protein
LEISPNNENPTIFDDDDDEEEEEEEAVFIANKIKSQQNILQLKVNG